MFTFWCFSRQRSVFDTLLQPVHVDTAACLRLFFQSISERCLNYDCFKGRSNAASSYIAARGTYRADDTV